MPTAFTHLELETLVMNLGSAGGGTIVPITGLTAGNTYTLVGQVKGLTATGSFGLATAIYASDANRVTITTSWQESSVTFVAGSSNYARYSWIGQNTYYVQNIRVYAGTDRHPNVPALETTSNFSALVSAGFSWTFDGGAAESQSAYQLQIATDSGFSDIVVDTTKTISSSEAYTLNAQTLIPGTAYYWRVNTWNSEDLDSGMSGTGAFSTLPNGQPSVSNVSWGSTGGIIASAEQNLTWTFSDSDAGDYQTAYQVDITNGVGTIYTTGKVSSGSTTQVIPADTLEEGEHYTVSVTVWDYYDQQSTAGTLNFSTVALGATEITSPVDGSTSELDSLTLAWNFSAATTEQAQAKYQVVVTNLSTSSTHLDTGEVTSTNTTVSVIGLDSPALYQFSVTITDALGAVADTDSAVVSIDYSSPNVPSASLAAYPRYIEVTVDNPTPTGSRAVPDYNEIYRASGDSDVYVRLGTVPVDGVYEDYRVAPGGLYQYKIRAVKE